MPTPEDFPRIDALMAGWVPTWPMTVNTVAEYLYCNQGISATCRGCGRTVAVDLIAIGEKLGRETRVDAVCRALRCGDEKCRDAGAPAIIVTRDGDNRLKWRPRD